MGQRSPQQRSLGGPWDVTQWGNASIVWQGGECREPGGVGCRGAVMVVYVCVCIMKYGRKERGSCSMVCGLHSMWLRGMQSTQVWLQRSCSEVGQPWFERIQHMCIIFNILQPYVTIQFCFMGYWLSLYC